MWDFRRFFHRNIKTQLPTKKSRDKILKNIFRWTLNFNLHLSFHHLRFPFNWQHPIGYLIAFTIQYIAQTYILIFTGCYMSLFVGTSFMLIAISKDLKENLRLLQIDETSTKSRLQVKKQLSEFVAFHSSVKELSQIDNWSAIRFVHN